MNKRSKEPDEMRMPAEKFDEVMRKALRVPVPVECNGKNEEGKKIFKREVAKVKR